MLDIRMLEISEEILPLYKLLIIKILRFKWKFFYLLNIKLAVLRVITNLFEFIFNINIMLKRKPTTQYTREGNAIESNCDYEDKNISTPEEIKNRKIYRVKRVTPQPKAGFILQSKLLPENLEAQLLQETKTLSVDFLSIPDEEVKEISPEKSKTREIIDDKDKQEELSIENDKNKQVIVETTKKKPLLQVESANLTSVSKKETLPYTNPLSSIIEKMNEKKEDELVNAFIVSNTPKTINIVTPQSFTGTPQKNILACLVSVEAQISVNHGDSRGKGYLEIAKGIIDEKKICSLIFKNQIKSVVYQAGITTKSKLKECNNWELGEDDLESEELEVEVFKKQGDKIVGDIIRILLSKDDARKLILHLEQAEAFLHNHN